MDGSSIVEQRSGLSMLDYLQIVWGGVFFLAILLGLEQYLYVVYLIPPIVFRFVFIISGILLFRSYINQSILRHPLFIFSIFYFLFCLMRFFAGGAQSYALDTMKGAIYMVVYALLLIISIPNMKMERDIYTTLGMIGMIIGAYTVYSDDGSLLSRFADNFIETDGPAARRAGNYLNANSAGFMFVWMLMFLILRLNKIAILPFIFLAIFIIILTLSRSGFLLFAIFITAYLLRGYLSRKFFFIVFGTVIFLTRSDALFEWILSLLPNTQADSVDRLSFFFLKNVSNAVENDDRYHLVEQSWTFFYESPFLGNGMGFTTIWVDETGTHNMMLMHLVEYGITGLWIMPGFMLALWKSGKGLDWQDKLIWCIIIFLGSFFSHNYFDSMIGVIVNCLLFFIPQTQKSRIA